MKKGGSSILIEWYFLANRVLFSKVEEDFVTIYAQRKETDHEVDPNLG